MVVTRIGIVIGKTMTEKGTIAIVVIAKTIRRTTKIRTVIVKGAGVTARRKSTTPGQGILTITTTTTTAATGSASLFLKHNLTRKHGKIYIATNDCFLKILKRYIECFQWKGFIIRFISNFNIYHKHELSGLARHFGYVKINKVKFGLNYIF
jgi:hypothetical protein